jgi:putative selenium metabolism protein SsnA
VSTDLPSHHQIHLLHSGTVVTGGRRPEVLTGCAIAWSGERILAVGPEAEVSNRYPQARRLDAFGGMVLPGLINLHHHLYSAFARGLAPAAPPRDFGQILDGLWWRLDRALTPETVRLSAQLGAAECIRWGCTTFFDHHASPSCIRGSLETVAAVLEEAGLSAVLCYEVSDRNGHGEALSGIQESVDFIDSHKDHPSIRGTLGLHASFTISDETLEEAAHRRPAGCGCHIHVAEDPIDREVSKRAYGATPMERLERSGFLDDKALLIHGVHLTRDEREVAADRGAVLVHCPESNANNGVGHLDVEDAVADGCTVALGTDGMSSAMLSTLRAAVLAQRAVRRSPASGFRDHQHLLNTNALVARRFFGEPLLGSLEEGAPADLCVIDAAPPTPIFAENLFGHLVYGAAHTPVRHTISRGRILLENFRHTTIDPLEIAEAAQEAAPELWHRFESMGATDPGFFET